MLLIYNCGINSGGPVSGIKLCVALDSTSVGALVAESSVLNEV